MKNAFVSSYMRIKASYSHLSSMHACLHHQKVEKPRMCSEKCVRKCWQTQVHTYTHIPKVLIYGKMLQYCYLHRYFVDA